MIITKHIVMQPVEDVNNELLKINSEEKK